jgi:hypothetical protein
MLMVERADKTGLSSVTPTADVSGTHDCISAWRPCIHCMRALESACMVYAAKCMCHMEISEASKEPEWHQPILAPMVARSVSGIALHSDRWY